MAEPWFDPIRWSWLPGTALGVVGGVIGTLAGVLNARAPGVVIGSLWVMLLGSAALLVAAIVALTQGQPYGVWYGLGLPGLLGTLMGACFLIFLGPVIRQAGREHEERRMQARDLG